MISHLNTVVVRMSARSYRFIFLDVFVSRSEGLLPVKGQSYKKNGEKHAENTTHILDTRAQKDDRF